MIAFLPVISTYTEYLKRFTHFWSQPSESQLSAILCICSVSECVRFNQLLNPFFYPGVLVTDESYEIVLFEAVNGE